MYINFESGPGAWAAVGKDGAGSGPAQAGERWELGAVVIESQNHRITEW